MKKNRLLEPYRSDVIGVAIFGPTDHPHSVTVHYRDFYDDRTEIRYSPITVRTYVKGAPWPVKGPGNHNEMMRKGEADGTYRPDLLELMAIAKRANAALIHAVLYAEDLRKKRKKR